MKVQISYSVIISYMKQTTLRAAAKELNVGVTHLKKICRNHGITRWDYRKFRAAQRLSMRTTKPVQWYLAEPSTQHTKRLRNNLSHAHESNSKYKNQSDGKHIDSNETNNTCHTQLVYTSDLINNTPNDTSDLINNTPNDSNTYLLIWYDHMYNSIYELYDYLI